MTLSCPLSKPFQAGSCTASAIIKNRALSRRAPQQGLRKGKKRRRGDKNFAGTLGGGFLPTAAWSRTQPPFSTIGLCRAPRNPKRGPTTHLSSTGSDFNRVTLGGGFLGIDSRAAAPAEPGRRWEANYKLKLGQALASRVPSGAAGGRELRRGKINCNSQFLVRSWRGHL